MAKDSGLYNSVAPLKNVAALVALIDRVQKREYGLPGMATFYGPSGFGKSYGCLYAANRFDACYVEVKSTWRPKFLCTAILIELGVKPRGTLAELAARVSEELAKTGRPLLIDEADFLVKQDMVELAREFHDSSGSPVILVGEELLPQKLQAWERVHGRMLDWVAAEAGTIDDVNHLAKIYCPGIALADDLRQHLLQLSGRSIRRICINLSRVHEVARVKGLDQIDLQGWGKSDFFSGAAPDPRRDLGVSARARRVA